MTDDPATGSPSGVPPVPPTPPDPPAADPRPRRRRRGLLSGPRAAWHRLPLRVQLTAVMLVLTTVCLSVTGVGALALLRNYLVDRVDAQIVSTARALDDSAFALNIPKLDDSASALPSTYFIGLISADGQLGFSVRNTLGDGDHPRLPPLTTTQVRQRSGEPFTVPGTRAGRDWRAVVLPTANSQLNLVVAVSLAETNGIVARAQGLVLVVGFVAILLTVWLAWAAIGRSFRPLHEVERTASAIAQGDLSRRVPAGPPGTEVGRLSSSLNTMLRNIESAFEARTRSEGRMRRFVADASHELRTPLASIRGFAELYRVGALGTPEKTATAMGRIESESIRMSGLVEDLLMLARMDERRPMDLTVVDLLHLAGDSVVDTRATSPDRQITLDGTEPGAGPRPVRVLGNEAKLHQVLVNLLTNAVRHTPAGTPIEVLVGPADDGRATIAVRDHGEGISPENRARVFERFFRADASRTRDTGGSGLGLAIVAAIVSAHHGSVEVDDTPGGGATFRVLLPALEAPERPATAPGDDEDAAVGDDHAPASDQPARSGRGRRPGRSRRADRASSGENTGEGWGTGRLRRIRLPRRPGHPSDEPPPPAGPDDDADS